MDKAARPDMWRQLHETRQHSALTRGIWLHVARRLASWLEPLARDCLDHRHRPASIERDLRAIEERVLGLAESCACVIFAANHRMEDFDPEDCHRPEVLEALDHASRMSFCFYVACTEMLVLFGLTRGNCAMPDVWPAMLLRSLQDLVQGIESTIPVVDQRPYAE